MGTTKVQLRRINILIEELEELRRTTKDIKFEMGTWCELEYVDDGQSATDLQKLIRNATKNPCGTAACLAGKAGLIPRIRKMGFMWNMIPRKNWADAFPCSAADKYHRAASW